MVEWKKLGEICTYYRGVTYNKKQEVSLGSGGTKILRANNITLDSNTLNFDDIKEVSSDVKIKDYQWLNPNDILICAGSGSKEHVGKVAFIFDRIGYAYGGFMGKLVVSEGLQSRFLFHVICSHLFKKYLEVALNSTTINNLNAEIVNNFQIPIPSLSEQTRIVGILDTFTASIENLKQQIAQRRKQYEHYRDQLLDLEGKEGVDGLVLDEICDVINGRAYKQEELLNEGKYRVLRVGNFFSNDSWYYSNLELEEKYYCEKGDLLYAWSASFGPHIWEGEKTIYHYHIWKMICKQELNKKFMYYWLQSENMRKQAFSHLHGATMAHLTKALMESLVIPVPSLSEQQRIVSILDTFEASIANLEQQLAQRERQYEYYRNKLLTFE